jgi:glutathione S-transferase
MKLYYAPGACSLSPHIVLREAGLPFELEKFDYATKKTDRGADYMKVNPKGYVPALELDNGEVLTEGPAIVQYIADRVPKSGLAPEWGSPERYRLQEWLNFITSELHKSIGPFFNPKTPEAQKDILRENFARRFRYVDQALASRPYLMGDKFTVADAYLFWVLSAANFLKIDLSPFANLGAFMKRVAARPKVQEALKAEGLAH